MIRNERQYRTTIRQRKVLSEALDGLLADGSPGLVGPPTDRDDSSLRYELRRASLAGQIAELDTQLHEYEMLRDGGLATAEVRDLADLPDALVRARISAGLTQRDLALRLGLKEQQIQRYESEEYASASLKRLREVMAALGVTLEGDLVLPDREVSLSSLRRNLARLGFNRDVINKRLLKGLQSNSGSAKVFERAQQLGSLLSVPSQVLFGDSSVGHLPALSTTARFKAASNAAHAALDAYTRYAEGVADIVLRATSHLDPPQTPGSDQDVRAAIDERAQLLAPEMKSLMTNSHVLLIAVLQYLYELRIPVIALRDPGAFHGACFTRSGRSVIVLKQTTDSSAKWLYDLLHELAHLRQPSIGKERSWIELGDISEWSDTPEEEAAHASAADILFYGRAEAVVTNCLRMAEGSVERLKGVVRQVAVNAEVPADVLANYLAFRLSQRGINWWPTAATFQQATAPWASASDLLLQQLELTAIDATERGVLIDVLAW